MISPAVVAVAAVLASCKSEPRIEGRRLIIWRDVRAVLDKYGVRYKYYSCRFEYRRKRIDPARARMDEKQLAALKRRKHPAARVEGGLDVVEYRRVKVIVYDYNVAVKATEILRNPEKARVVFARYSNIAKEVLLLLRSISVSARKYFARATLRKIFSLYNTYVPGTWRRPYEKHLRHELVRRILPNWRGSRYKMFLLCKPYMLESIKNN